MFDIGFAELVLLLLIGLLVLGPERLPRVARDAGLYLRKARIAWAQLRSSIERELDAAEVKQAISEAKDQTREMTEQLKSGTQSVADTLKSGTQPIADQLKDTMNPAEEKDTPPPADTPEDDHKIG